MPSPRDPALRPASSLRRSPNKRDNLSRTNPASNKSKNKLADILSRRNATPALNSSSASAVDRLRSNPDDSRPNRRNSAKTPKELAQTLDRPLATGVVMRDEDPSRSANKTNTKFPGSSSMYILKPLRPGEKRKRGRPSFSDYVLAGSTAGDLSSPEDKKDPKPTLAEKLAPPKPASTPLHSLRRRKSTSSLTKPLPVPPAIVKKEKSHSKPIRRIARSPGTVSNPQVSPPSAENNIPNETTHTTTEKALTPAHRVSKDDNDGALNIKRPRGRPRKDGSWPVARGRKTDAASKPAPSVAPKPAPGVITKADQAGKDSEDKVVENKENDESSVPSTPAVQLPTSSAFPAPSSSTPAPVTTSVTNDEIAVEKAEQIGDAVMVDSEQKAGSSAPDAVPSNVIDTTDIQMQDMSEKEIPKPQPAPENVPKDVILDQVVGEVTKKDSNEDVASPLVTKDLRIERDVVFPQSEQLREPVDLDIPLGAPSRSENVANVPDSTVPVAAQPPPTQEKFMTSVSAFPMSNMDDNPVTNPMDGGLMPVIVSKQSVGAEKEDSGASLDTGDSKKPFKRPRGRPRKENQWANTGRPKPMNEEAVERVKDLNDPGQTLAFPMEPSGAV